MRCPFLRSLALFMTLAVLTPLQAQVGTASLGGFVTDSSGAVITNAKVEATSAATALRRELQTSANGAYLMPGLPIGRYTVTFSHEGFKTVRYTDVELSASPLNSHSPSSWTLNPPGRDSVDGGPQGRIRRLSESRVK